MALPSYRLDAPRAHTVPLAAGAGCSCYAALGLSRLKRDLPLCQVNGSGSKRIAQECSLNCARKTTPSSITPLPFGPGLNLLTGETGAGKSILVDALALLMGGKASAEVVRHGADKAVVVRLRVHAGRRGHSGRKRHRRGRQRDHSAPRDSFHGQGPRVCEQPAGHGCGAEATGAGAGAGSCADARR
jgi:hypothetical protein